VSILTVYHKDITCYEGILTKYYVSLDFINGSSLKERFIRIVDTNYTFVLVGG